MRYGMQKGAIDQEQRKGIFVNNSLMSDELQKVGYATAAVGKWCVLFWMARLAPCFDWLV